MKDGGSAFPSTKYWDARFEEMHAPEATGGMSLRSWYAGMALTGVFHAAYKALENSDTPREMGNAQNIAILAFEVADAMIAEGEK